jgi:hypothetical protein
MVINILKRINMDRDELCCYNRYCNILDTTMCCGNCRLPLINNNVHVCSKGSVQGVGSKEYLQP